MRDDALYTYCPRWLEESPIPEELVALAGEAGWSVLKKIIETETEQNFFPDWFLVNEQDLARWSGILPGRLEEVLQCLEEQGYLERQGEASPGGLRRFRILEPLLNEEEAEAVRTRLKSRGYVGVRNLTFRYIDPMPAKAKFRTVKQMYEEVFGLRMNTRIADDLREITERFDLALIINAFEEIRRKSGKSLASVITALYRGERNAEKKEN